MVDGSVHPIGSAQPGVFCWIEGLPIEGDRVGELQTAESAPFLYGPEPGLQPEPFWQVHIL